MYEISIHKSFSAAHALRLADGSCEPLHGHDWQVEVTVASDALDAMETVMDFHVLEADVEAILSPLHNGNLNEIEPFATEVNPSAERVAWWIARQVGAKLPEGVRLRSVCVEESPGCLARYVGER